ncbi:hypothetical protein [Streptomyces bullii]|uniref:Uncharacterized protein n=1 Tax=Streptomyces bullii TaxID=349910 RepID=A0ABW0UUF9_9ACTN
MIAYVFLGVGCTGVVGLILIVVAWRSGTGSGARRATLTKSEMRHELLLARHQLDGSGHYIGRLEHDLGDAYEELDATRDQRDNALAAVEKAGLRIAELEEQVRDRDQLRDTVRALKAELANARRITPLPPHGATPPPGARVIPLHQTPFAISPAPRPS